MNFENSVDNSTPVRRTARARKVNSRFVGDDIDEGYRKLVDRITASDSLRKKEPKTIDVDSKLVKIDISRSSSRATSISEEFDENSNFDNERDTTKLQSKSESAFQDHNLSVAVNSNHNINKKEDFEDGTKSSHIIKYRSSTDTDSEDESKVMDPIEQALMRLDKGVLPDPSESAKLASLSTQHNSTVNIHSNSLETNKNDQQLRKDVINSPIGCPSTTVDKQPKIMLSTKTSMEAIPGKKIKILSLKPITLKSTIPSAMKAEKLELKLVTSPDSTPRMISSPTFMKGSSNLSGSSSKLNSPFTSDGEDDMPLNTFVKKSEEFPFEDSFKFIKKPGESLVSKILKSDSLMKKKSQSLSSPSSKIEKKAKIKKNKGNKKVRSKAIFGPKKKKKRNTMKSNMDEYSMNDLHSVEEQDDVPLKLLIKKDKENIDGSNDTLSPHPSDSALFDESDQDSEQDEMPLTKLFHLDTSKKGDLSAKGSKFANSSKKEDSSFLIKEISSPPTLMKDKMTESVDNETLHLKKKKSQKDATHSSANVDSVNELSNVKGILTMKDNPKIVLSKTLPTKELAWQDYAISPSASTSLTKSEDSEDTSTQGDNPVILSSTNSVGKKASIKIPTKSGKIVKKRFRGLDAMPTKKMKKAFKISSGLFSPKKAIHSSHERSNTKTKFIKIEENGQEYVLMPNFGDDIGLESESASLSTKSEPLANKGISEAKSSAHVNKPKKNKKEKILVGPTKNLQAKSSKKRKSLFSSKKKQKNNKEQLKKIKKRRFRSLDADATALPDSKAAKDVQSIIPGSKLISLSSLVLEIPLKDNKTESDGTHQVNPSNVEPNTEELQEDDQSQDPKSKEIPAKVKKSPPRIKIKVRRHSKTLKLKTVSMQDQLNEDTSEKLDNTEGPTSQLRDRNETCSNEELDGKSHPSTDSEEGREIESKEKDPLKNASEEKKCLAKDWIDNKIEVEKSINLTESTLAIEKDENESKTLQLTLMSPEEKNKTLDSPSRLNKEKLPSSDNLSKSQVRQTAEGKEKEAKKKHRDSSAEGKEKHADLPKTKASYDSKDKVSNSDDFKRKQEPYKDKSKDSPSKPDAKEDSSKNVPDFPQKVKSKDQTPVKLKFSESLFLRDLELKDKDKSFFIKKKPVNKDKLKESESKERPRYSFLKGNVSSKDVHSMHKMKVSSDSSPQESKDMQYKISSKEKSKDSKRDKHDERKREREKSRDSDSKSHSSDTKGRRRESKTHGESRNKDKHEEFDKPKHKHFEEKSRKSSADNRDKKSESRHKERDKNKDYDSKSKHKKINRASSLENDSKTAPVEKSESPHIGNKYDFTSITQYSSGTSKKRFLASSFATETSELNQTKNISSLGEHSTLTISEQTQTSESEQSNREKEVDSEKLDVARKSQLEIKLLPVNEDSQNVQTSKSTEEKSKDVESSRDDISKESDFHQPHSKRLIEGSDVAKAEENQLANKLMSNNKDDELSISVQRTHSDGTSIHSQSEREDSSLRGNEVNNKSSLYEVKLMEDEKKEQTFSKYLDEKNHEDDHILEQSKPELHLKDEKSTNQDLMNCNEQQHQIKLESKVIDETNLSDADASNNSKTLNESKELENQECILKDENIDKENQLQVPISRPKEESHLTDSKLIKKVGPSNIQPKSTANQYASFGLASLLQRMREPKQFLSSPTSVDNDTSSEKIHKEKDKIPSEDSSFKQPLSLGNDESSSKTSSETISNKMASAQNSLITKLKPDGDLDEIFDSPISPPMSDARNDLPKASPQKFMTKIYKDNLDFVCSLSGNEQTIAGNKEDLSQKVYDNPKEGNETINKEINTVKSRSSRRSFSNSPKRDEEEKPDSKRKSDRNKKRQMQIESNEFVSNSDSSSKEKKDSNQPEVKILANGSHAKRSRWDTQVKSVSSNDNREENSILDQDSKNPNEVLSSAQSLCLENKSFNNDKEISDDNKENVLLPQNESPVEDTPPPQKKELTPEERAEIEKRNAKIVADRMKSFELLEENLYLTEKKKCKRAKEVRRMLCDCSLTKEEIANGEMGCGEDCLNRMLMIECGPRCPLKDHCTNRHFQQRKYSKVEVFNAESKGCGVRTCEDVLPGAFIMEYIGEVFDTREFKKRKKEYAKESSSHFYFMALRSGQLIDATRKGNISRFVNHSCDPNCETQKWTVNGELRIGFFSTKFIPAGEEINFDYRLERYGREPQKCYCGTPFCRGWLGEPPDEKTKEEKEEDRRKELKDKKRKEERRLYLEDMDLEEEIEKLHERGLRNRQDTLDLSRLMVRAEINKARMSLLHLLRTSEPACRRLFLDYHGLKLLWSWMADISSSSKNAPLRLEILKTLECLPITNKTQLTDSRILSIVERWSKQSAESKSSPVKSTPDSSTLPKTDKKATKKSSDTSEDSDTEAAESSETPSPDENSLDANESSNEKSNEASKPPLVPSTNEDLNKALPSNSDSSTTTQPNQESESSVAMSDVINLAQKLLPEWTNLSEAFRIPKKERIEMMKEHEREVDKGYREYLAREKKSDKDRYEGWGSSRDRNRDKRRERRRNERSQRESKDTDDEDKGLTKEERREKFAKLVAKQDEERLWKLQQEMWALHLQRCSLLGHNPYLTPIFDPTGQFYWDPGNMSWQAYVGPDPNLPVPANYGAPDPSMKSPQDIIDEQHKFMAGAFYPLPHPPLPEGEPPPPSASSDAMDLASIPLPGEVPLPPAPGNSPPNEVALMSIPLPGEMSEPFGAMGAELNPLPPPGSVTINLPPKWKIARNADGYLYFYHSKTRVSQWNIPSPDQHKQLMVQFRLSANSDSESDSDSSSSSSSDSEFFSSEEEEEAEDKEVTVVRTSDGMCEKMIRSTKSKPKRSEKLVQERVISPILFEDREAARRERREAKVRAREEARNERWQLYKSLKEKHRAGSFASKRERQLHSSSARQEDDTVPDSPKDDDDHLDLQLLKFSKRQKLNDGRSHQKGKSKERMVTAMADNSELARKIKDNFRAKMATYIVSVLNPYRRVDCKEGRIVNTEDFKYLARKLTHFVMVKELKQLPSIEGLEYSESVKHKTKEFVRKYMSKYGSKFKRDPNDTKEY